jgi:hypothetical protein
MRRELVENFFQKSAYIGQAFKKHSQKANDYRKLFEGVHISNIQHNNVKRIILV